MAIEVEEYEKIRHLKEHEHLSQRAVAELLGLSRNTVKKYWKGESVPWLRKEGSGRNNDVITDDVIAFIKACLEEDKASGLKKQHHTAKRIYDRLVTERSFTGCESSVRGIVAELKQQPRDAFVPLEYYPGESVQVDWGEATVCFDGIKTKINIWCMRECYSDDFFCCAFYRQNEESFLEGMRKGLEYFGGAPQKVIFDNARVAVKEGFGLHAKTTEKYQAMSAHYAFKPVFCNIASGNEKGLVEGLVGFVRRNTMVPVPRVKNMDELNDILMKACIRYRTHTVPGKSLSVGEMVHIYQNNLIALPPYRFDTSRTLQMKADEFSLVRYDHNKYSVPYTYSGKSVTVKGYGNAVKFFCRGETIACYTRDYQYNQTHYCLEHYIDLIARKPRSVYNAAPVRHTVPKELQDFLVKLDNPKAVVKVLRLYLEYGERAVEASAGASSYEALEAKLIPVIRPNACIKNEITVVMPDLSRYDVLLKGGA